MAANLSKFEGMPIKELITKDLFVPKTTAGCITRDRPPNPYWLIKVTD
jgi:hypothetical protein